MKTRTNTLASMTLGIAFLGLLLPMPQAAAGQKEWATAGKILTGVVVGQALFGNCPTTTVVRHGSHGPRPHSSHSAVFVTPTYRYGHGSMRRHSSWPSYSSYGSSFSISTTRVVQAPPQVVYVDREVPVYIEKPVVVQPPPAPVQPGSQPTANILGRDFTLRFEGSSIYADISDYVRIYQPRVKGHIAFLQERAQPGYAWITKSEHPSIW